MVLFRRAILRAQADDLAPEVLAALAAIGECRTPVLHLSYTPEPAIAPIDNSQIDLEADPLLSAGIEV
jgi:hypothetical protein